MNDNLIVTYRDIAITYDEQKDKWFFTHTRQGHRDRRIRAVELRPSVSPVKGGYGPRHRLLLLGQVNCGAAGRPSSEGGFSAFLEAAVRTLARRRKVRSITRSLRFAVRPED